MPRKRTKKKRKPTVKVKPFEWEYLCRGRIESADDFNPLSLLMLVGGNHLVQWKRCQDQLLSFWITRWPGTRPWAWWIDALDRYGPRKRLGGIGNPVHEHLAVKQIYSFGIPVLWITPAIAALHAGLLTQGERISFSGIPVDVKDPPVFETEAAYLQRHDLLSDQEQGVDTEGCVSIAEHLNEHRPWWEW